MTDKQKQIEEIKDTIDSVYGCDCAYYGVEGFAIAEELYNAGYRKQIEREWLDKKNQIAEMAKISCYVCEFGHGFNGDCDLGKDEPCSIALEAAEKLYEIGYRKPVEDEWEERILIIFDTEKVGYHCPKCNTTWDVKTNYCPNCGKKMRGGEST